MRSSAVTLLLLPALSAFSQNLDFIPAVRLQLIANNPEAWGGSLELGYRDSMERRWITVRVLSLSGSQDYSASGFDISDKFRAVGIGGGLTSGFSHDWALDYGLYLDYMWARRAVAGDPLNWSRSYHGQCFDPSVALRLRHQLGGVVDLCFGFEAGYRWMLSIEQGGPEIAIRPLGNDPFASCSFGLVLRLQ